MLAVLFILAVPSVLAAPATGLLTATGEVRLAARTETVAAPLALLGTDAAALGAFEIRAPHARVTIFELTYLAADLVVDEGRVLLGNPEPRTLLLDDVVVRLEAPRDGWFGFYPAPTSQLTLRSERALLIEPTSQSTVSTRTASTGDQPNSPWYAKTIDGPHLHLQSFGALQATGGGAWKVKGGDFAIASRQENLTVSTGEWRPAPHELRMRWAFIEFEEAETLVDAGVGPLAIAALGADVAWKGDLVADAAEGEIVASGERYRASGGAAVVSGSFASRVYPVSGPDAPRAVVTLDGDLRGASLPSTSTPVSAAARGATPLWPAWLAGAFLVAGAAFVAGILVWRARVRLRTGSFTADDCAAFAWRAAEEEDWTAAAAWIERARKLAPGSDRLWKDEGFFHEELGHHDEALDRYVRAVELRPDAFTCVRIARLHVTLGAPEDEVEAWLDRACGLDAAAFDDIAEEAAFASLLRTPRFARFARPSRRGRGGTRAGHF